MEWLLPGRIGDIPNQVFPGQALAITPPPEVSQLTVTRPDGTSTDLVIQDDHALYTQTTQLGVYKINWGEDQSLAFAVNLSNPQESNTHPRDNLPLLAGVSSTHDNLHQQQARNELWRPLVVIALIIFFIEWLVYNRATLAKMRYKVLQKKIHSRRQS